MTAAPVRVLVVDDSAFMRAVIRRVLERAGRFEVVGEARDGREAVDAAARVRPDVITMDVNMPVMGGVEAVQQIMRERPVPVVMLSAHTTEGADATVEALSAGAVDFVTKPSGEVSADLARIGGELVRKLELASRARPRAVPPALRRKPRVSPAAVTWSPQGPRVVVIAASTGGPAALSRVIPALPATLDAAVLVVQHMPAGFIRALAARLDGMSSLEVSEAGEGERLHQGRVFVAPGDRHLELLEGGRIHLSSAAPVNSCRPAADVTMHAVASLLGPRATGVVLTGMGRDGAQGLAEIRRAGGRTVAQDERSCVVYGMPRAAVELGVVDRVLTPEAIATVIASPWRR